MGRQFKIVQCPECTEYTYVPVGMHRNFCPCCNAKIALHDLAGEIVNNVREAQRLVQERQYALHGVSESKYAAITFHPAQQVLQILRCYQTDCPQWFSIHEVYQRCIEVGLLPKEIQEAIDALNAEGFIEKREDTIRAIPLN